MKIAHRLWSDSFSRQIEQKKNTNRERTQKKTDEIPNRKKNQASKRNC